MATDRPPQKILAPPAVLAAVCIGIGAAAEHFRPWPFFFGSFAARLGVSTLLFAAFGLILLMALRAFRQHHTTVSPYGKATALVTSGPFRFSRNPIYVGLLLVALAFAVALDSAWQLVVALLLLLLLHFGVVLREERFLAAEFGDAYRDYARRVRRWL
jgi:protein-S-isoprenylcysteine O-methyltransferase Ste14